MKRIAKVFGTAALGLALLATTAQAQSQSSTPVTWNVGVGLSLPSNSRLNTGFHARFGAMIPLESAPVWIRPEVGLGQLGVSCARCGSLTLFDIGADVGYTFKTTTEIGWYILGGLQITDHSFSNYSTSFTRLGMNLGGGMTFPLANHVGYLELRYASTGGNADINVDIWALTFGLRF